MISRSKATVKIVLVHSSKKSKVDGKQLIQLRVTYNRKPKYYGLGYSVHEEDFHRLFAGQVRGELRNLKIKLQRIESLANEIIQTLDVFSFAKFEKRFIHPVSGRNSVFSYLQNEITIAQQEGRIKSKTMANSSLNSFKEFSGRADITFDDISVDWLRNYEKFMSEKGNSLTTAGMYLRTLRVAFNKAICDGVISNDVYPFGKNKYRIPVGNNPKKAINRDELQRLLNYQPTPGSKEDWAKDMWIFILVCQGINPKDLASLKFKDMDSGSISFYRSKTSRTRKQTRAVIVPVDDYMEQIIQKWGNSKHDPQSYVFKILQPGLTPEQVDNRGHDFYSKINSNMKSIAEKVGISKKLTTMTARHSYASFLLHDGAPVKLISESMGHSNIRTTENYLASFGLDTQREWNSRILNP